MQRTLIQGCRGSDFNARVLGGRVSLQRLGARGQGMVLQEMTAWLGMKNMTEHVPPYITKWVHLSMNCTSSRGVSGKKGTNDSIHISVIQATEKGYFLTNWIILRMFTSYLVQNYEIIINLLVLLQTEIELIWEKEQILEVN